MIFSLLIKITNMGKVYIEDDKLIVKTDNGIIKSDGTFYAELNLLKFTLLMLILSHSYLLP